MDHPISMIVIILIPLLTSIVAFLNGPNNLRRVVVIGGAALQALCYALWLRAVDGADLPHFYVLPFASSLYWIDLHPDIFSLWFGGVVSSLWLITSLYAAGYAYHHHLANQQRFFGCLSLAISMTMLIVFSGSIVTSFIAYEMLTLSTVFLITLRASEESIAAGRTYLYTLLGTSLVCFLPAILLSYYVRGSMEFSQVLSAIQNLSPWVMGVMFTLFVCGVAKTAIMPFHQWLISAMAAPTPVSALLHAVAVVKSGIFIMAKIMIYTIGLDRLYQAQHDHWITCGWLTLLASVTIIMASLTAFQQTHLKRVLAYSTIAQLAYCMLGFSFFTPYGIAAGLLHMVGHSFAKITLFFSAGTLGLVNTTLSLPKMDGLAKVMPWSAACFTIGALSLIGIPPTIGFITKFSLVVAAGEELQYMPIAVIVIATLLNAGYFVPIIYRFYFRPCEIDGAEERGDAAWSMRLPMVLTAGLAIGFAVVASDIMASLMVGLQYGR